MSNTVFDIVTDPLRGLPDPKSFTFDERADFIRDHVWKAATSFNGVAMTDRVLEAMEAYVRAAISGLRCTGYIRNEPKPRLVVDWYDQSGRRYGRPVMSISFSENFEVL